MGGILYTFLSLWDCCKLSIFVLFFLFFFLVTMYVVYYTASLFMYRAHVDAKPVSPFFFNASNSTSLSVVSHSYVHHMTLTSLSAILILCPQYVRLVRSTRSVALRVQWPVTTMGQTLSACSPAHRAAFALRGKWSTVVHVYILSSALQVNRMSCIFWSLTSYSFLLPSILPPSFSLSFSRPPLFFPPSFFPPFVSVLPFSLSLPCFHSVYHIHTSR